MSCIARSVAVPITAAVILHAVYVGIFLAKHAGDPSALLCAGRSRVGKPPYEAVTHPVGPSGHDGQFYYALARSPWTTHNLGIDSAPGRHVRILYPALCWLCSGGHARLLFLVMPGVNLATIAFLTWMGVRLARHYGQSDWTGFLLPIALNLGLSLIHNFTDCLSALAVVGLIMAWLTGRSVWTTGLFAAAALLSREQNIAVVGIVLGTALWERRLATVAGAAGGCALWLAWVGLLWRSYGVAPFLPGEGAFDLPGIGMQYRWTHLGGASGFSTRLAIINGLAMLHLSLLMLVAAYLIGRRPGMVVSLVLLAGIALALVAGMKIYSFAEYTRVFVWLPLGIWLGALKIGRPRLLWSLSPAVLWPVFEALGFA